jgi:hypothetical protein
MTVFTLLLSCSLRYSIGSSILHYKKFLKSQSSQFSHLSSVILVQSSQVSSLSIVAE